MNPEAFEKKLYNARDIESNPNVEGIEVIREFERALGKYKSFVGLASFGSTLGGYGNKDCDIDVFILFDKPGDADAAHEDDYDKLRLRAFEWQEEIQKRGIKVDFRLQNVNPDSLIKSMKFWIGDRGTLGEYVPESLEAMTRVVTGNKIEGYRKELAVKLNELDPDQKRIVVEETMRALIKRDESSLSKRMMRMPKLSKAEHQKILDERQTLWRSRLQKIWNL